MLGVRVAAVLSVIVVLSIPFVLAATPVAGQEPCARIDLRVTGLHAGAGTISVDEAGVFDTIYYACPDISDNGQDTDQIVGVDGYTQGPRTTGDSVPPLREEIPASSSLTPSALDMNDASLNAADVTAGGATAAVPSTPAGHDADANASDDADSASSSDPSASCDVSDAPCSGVVAGVPTPRIRESDTPPLSSRCSSSDHTNRR